MSELATIPHESPIGMQLTTEEAARTLRVSAQTVRKWMREIPDFPRPARCGRRLLFSAAELAAYLERQRQGGAHAR